MSAFRKLLIGTCAAIALSGCDDVTSEARRASSEGRVINNNVMMQLYPETFVAGTPSYLERDFEAGANFICDELKMKRGRDICADSDINWR